MGLRHSATCLPIPEGIVSHQERLRLALGPSPTVQTTAPSCESMQQCSHIAESRLHGHQKSKIWYKEKTCWLLLD
ncbi:hypothetical protein QQP08_027903 [Theobroma cacao]|nr:hypothetical protein QQP08_027903 [Theobroma cacao]